MSVYIERLRAHAVDAGGLSLNLYSYDAALLIEDIDALTVALQSVFSAFLRGETLDAGSPQYDEIKAALKRVRP